MKPRSIIIFILTGILFACGTDETKVYSVNGKAQKGPLITGTTITLNELNEDLSQTGRSFTSTITSDDGTFSLGDIELASNLGMLTANGFYFNEIYGNLSSATVTLQAIVDLGIEGSININILTHLVMGRIETLVAEGKSFNQARDQAESEMLDFMNASDLQGNGFETMDISVNGDAHALLLATSLIFQYYTSSLSGRQVITAEMTQLMTNFRTDLADNGMIDNQGLIDKILSNISTLNLIDIRNYIEARYAELGHSVTIPSFETCIWKFQEKHSNQIYTDFYYPPIESPVPEIAPDGKVENILVKEDTLFEARAYSIAAITPLGGTLKINFIGQEYTIWGPYYGWEVINNYPEGFTLISQRQNQLMSMGIDLNLIDLSYKGHATIEYYENDMDTPTYVKTITWFADNQDK